MEVLAIFSGGNWVHYTPRPMMTVDPRVTYPLRQRAAAAYVGALQKGFQEERAHILAEACVFKDIYDELMFDKSIERDLKVLMGRGGKA